MMKLERINVARGREKIMVLRATGSAAYSVSLADGARAEVAIVNLTPIGDDVEIKVDAVVGKKAALTLIGCTLGGGKSKAM